MDLKTLVGMEEVPTFKYLEVDGTEKEFGGRRFPMGQAAVILQEITHLAKGVNFSEHWKEAMVVSNAERDNYRELTAGIGPPPVEPLESMLDTDSEDYDPNKYRAMKDEYDNWFKKIVAIQRPRGVMDILQESLVPELINLIDLMPESIFKVVAITITPYKDLRQSKEEENYTDFLKKRMSYCEDNLDLAAVSYILFGMFKLIGIETFFKILQIQMTGNLPEETEKEQPPIPITRRKKKIQATT